MAQSRLDILIQAKNQASAGIKSATNDLAGMQQQGGLASAAMGKLGAAMGAAFGAAAVAGMGKAAFELARLSAQATDVATSFDIMSRQAGTASDQLLSGLRDASRGAIGDFELTLAANRAMLLGVADNTEEFSSLMDVARARSQAMGMTTQQAFSDIVTGIGRMSPLILDNLGIVVNQEAANEAYAASLGKTASQLSDNERKQALLNAVLRDSAQLVRENEAAGDDAASNFERMDAAIANARDAMGTLFQPAMVVVARGIADAAQAAADGMTAMAERGDSLETLQMKIDGLSAALANHQQQLETSERGTKEWDIASKRVAETQQELAGYTAQLNARLQLQANATMDADTAMRQASGSTAMLRGEFVALGDAADSTTPKIVNMGLQATLAAEQFDAAMSRTRSNMQSLQGIASGLVDNLGAGGTQDWLNEQNTMLRLYQQQWRDIDGYSQDYIDNVMTPAYLSTLREQSSELDKARDKTVKLAAAVPQVSKEFQNLQSAVQSALSGALDPGVGVDPDKLLEDLFGFREDSINENARRLADIAANGLKDQDWLGKFAQEAPNIWQAIRMASNPQEEAAFLLRDFQDGLRPDLIDKDRAKEIVRRMIRGDANMADLAREISEELAAEMGIPLQEALAKSQAALGVGGSGAGSEIGEALGQGAVDAMSTGGKGAEAVDAFVSSMRAVYSRLNSAGQDAGKQWGSGFMESVGESVPPQLINMLVNLVTPGVMAEFYQRGTLTGAES